MSGVMAPGSSGRPAVQSRPRLTIGVVLILGVALMVTGCLLPKAVVYLPGVFALACAAAMALRLRSALAGRAGVASRLFAPVSIFVLVCVLGIAVPALMAWSATRHDVLWRAPGQEIGVVSSGRAYVESDETVRVADVATGRPLWTARGTNPDVAADVGVVLWNEDGLARYDARGHLEWRRPRLIVQQKLKGYLRTVALTTSTTVIGGCLADPADVVPRPSRCRYLGIGPDGSVRWQRTYAHAVAAGGDGVGRAVALRLAGKHNSSLLVLAPDTGDVLLRAPAARSAIGDLLVTVGDRVIAAGPHCSLVAYRHGQVVWRDRFMAPVCDWPTTLTDQVKAVYPDRLYLWDYESTIVTVDLADGKSRVFESGELGDDADNAALGKNVIAHLDGRRLTVVDAATGRRLWRRELDASCASYHCVFAADGVAVVEPLRSHNPFLEEVRGRPVYRIESFAPRSGRLVASTTDTSGEDGPSVEPVGGGYAVLHADDDGYVIGPGR